jgi:hypothetical protein
MNSAMMDVYIDILNSLEVPELLAQSPCRKNGTGHVLRSLRWRGRDGHDRDQFPTSGQALWSIGKNASSPGIVRSTS